MIWRQMLRQEGPIALRRAPIVSLPALCLEGGGTILFFSIYPESRSYSAYRQVSSRAEGPPERETTAIASRERTGRRRRREGSVTSLCPETPFVTALLQRLDEPMRVSCMVIACRRGMAGGRPSCGSHGGRP